MQGEGPDYDAMTAVGDLVTDHVRTEIQGDIAHIVLARPERLNALTLAMLAAIEQACGAIAESNARTVVIRGDGRSFCAGMDLEAFRSGPLLTADPERRYDAASLGRSATDAIAGLPQVTVAALHGHVVGGGVVLAAACDFAVADWSATLSIPEIDVGIPLAWGGIERLVAAVGPMRAKELVMTGRRFTAEEAASWGLVTRLVPDGEALDGALDLAAVIAGKPRFPIATTKRHVAEVASGDSSRDDAMGLVAAMEDPESAAMREQYLARFD